MIRGTKLVDLVSDSQVLHCSINARAHEMEEEGQADAVSQIRNQMCFRQLRTAYAWSNSKKHNATRAEHEWSETINSNTNSTQMNHGFGSNNGHRLSQHSTVFEHIHKEKNEHPPSERRTVFECIDEGEMQRRPPQQSTLTPHHSTKGVCGLLQYQPTPDTTWSSFMFPGSHHPFSLKDKTIADKSLPSSILSYPPEIQ